MSANPVGAVVTAIGLLITAGALLLEYWDPISGFFVKMWAEITGAFSSGIDFVMGLLEPFLELFTGLQGLFAKFGIFTQTESEKEIETPGTTATGTPPSRQVITANSQIRQILTTENIQTSQAELLIRDESGRAELGGITEIPGVKIKMLRSGD